MAGSKTAYLSKALLDHVLGRTTYTAPATLYVALSSAAFTADATGSAMSELNGANYARLALTNDGSHWAAATLAAPAVKTNTGAITFPAATGSWGLPASVYLCDASTGGNALYGADLNGAAAIGTGAVFSIDDGAFLFNED